MGRSTELSMPIRASKARSILIGTRGWHQKMGWKKTKPKHHKKLMKLVNLGEPTSFLDHVPLGCTQRECKSNVVHLKSYLVGRNLTRKQSLCLTTCEEMRGKILRIGRQKGRATVQSLCSMPGRPSVQKERTGNGWRIVKRLLSKRPEMHIFGTNW